MRAAARLRPLRPGDLPAMRALVEKVLREYGLWRAHRPGLGDLRNPEAAYRGGAFLVAEAAGRLVGCGGLLPLKGGRGEIRRMYLLKQARGRGLGRRLLSRLVARARARGLRRLLLETSPRFQDAIALYLSAGFDACVLDDDCCCNIVMFRDLN